MTLAHLGLGSVAVETTSTPIAEPLPAVPPALVRRLGQLGIRLELLDSMLEPAEPERAEERWDRAVSIVVLPHAVAEAIFSGQSDPGDFAEADAVTGRPESGAPSPLGGERSSPCEITDAEARVLRYLPSNLTAAEIASELWVSVNTVKTHMRHIYAKLDAHRRGEAVEQATARGLLRSKRRLR
jgi:DNA-binding CsgD family transcriptional regulator